MTKPARRLARYVRMAVLGAGLIVPTLTLIPLGSLWLWEHGLVLYWALAVCLFTVVAFVLQRRLFPAPVEDGPRAAVETGEVKPDALTPAEEQAWAEVERLAAAIDPAALANRDQLWAKGLETVDAVARSFHPSIKDPLWQFTVIEALALSERVSVRMREAVADHVPFGDRLTVSQLMKLWSWRGAIDVAERAYDAWRVVRLFNPLSAATQEVREQLQKRLYAWGKDQVARRVAEAYVREVGRAAIDLYSGKLSVTEADLARHRSDAAARDRAQMLADTPEPLRLLVGGQTGAGKSSLVNAMAAQVMAAVDVLPATVGFTPYALNREGLPAAIVLDSPGLNAGEPGDAIIAQSQDCDLLLWVVSAARADRDVDRSALMQFRSHFAAQPNRRRPPLLLVITHIDRLRPFKEWEPPYDLADAGKEKARSIRAATEAIAAELGFSAEDAVPVCLSPACGSYNVDALWGRILATLPEAQRAQLVRRLRDRTARVDWGRVWSQARNAGRVIARTVIGT